MQFGVGISLSQTLNNLSDVDTAGVTDGYIIHYDNATSTWLATADTGTTTVYDVIGFSVLSGRVITTGSKAFREIPFNCTISGWKLVADTSTSNSLKISIQKTTDYSSYDEVISQEIDKPQLTNAKSAEDFTLSNWDLTTTKDEILRFTIDSISNVKQLHFFLTIASS